jgi:hypothetical protein
MVEIGVYEGEFAAGILEACDRIERYYLLDPWWHLANWNKPFNTDNAGFERIFASAQMNTDFAGKRRVFFVERPRSDRPDLRWGTGFRLHRRRPYTAGITIDLVRVYPKVRSGGLIGGDDFCENVWYHSSQFEPSLVFPFAVYFAVAVGAAIYSLPNMQFCLYKPEEPRFEFVDLTGGEFGEISLRHQFAPQKFLTLMLGERFPRLTRIVAKAKGAFR